MMKASKTSVSVERGTCAQLLKHLADDGARESSLLTGKRAVAVETLARQYRPLADRELEGILNGQPMETGDKGAIHLRPVLKGTPALMPLVRARVDFSLDPLDAQFRVALFDIEGDLDHVIGWRFETPSQGGPGMHDYHHAQPIKGFAKRQPFSSAQWYNETTPAFLLDAYSPASLILAMLVSLYGITYIDELLKLDFRNEIVSVTKNMKSIQDYWDRKKKALSSATGSRP